MQICETQRLLVRHFSLDDVPALSAILSDPEVMKHSLNGVCDEARTRGFIEWCLASYESPGVGPWALIDKSTAALIGFCGAGPETINGKEALNFGYRLARNAWHQGLATEAAKAIVNVFCERRLAHRVVVIIEPEHLASLRVAEKAGFSEFEVVTFHGRPVRLYRLTSAPSHSTA